MKRIKVYGPGCKRCEATVAMMNEAAQKLGIAVEVEKISDPKAIALAGVMSTPGVTIDGRLVHAGGLPDPDKVEVWLKA